MCRVPADVRVWDGMRVSLLQTFLQNQKNQTSCYCYTDSFWPQSGRDVQDNRMLRSCLFACVESWTRYGHFLRMRAPLTCQSVWGIISAHYLISGQCSEFQCYHLDPHLKISLCYMHVIDTIMRCGFELMENYSCMRIRAFWKLPK